MRNEIWRPLLAILGRLLPARRLVVFDSSDLRPTNADARVISEYLHAQHPDIEQVWVHRGRPTRVPAYAEAVRRLSPRHAWLVARARWRLDDGTAALDIRSRPDARTTFVLDGVPITRVGLDDPSVQVNRAATRDVRRRSRGWTTVLAPSRYAEETARSAFAYSGDVPAVGLARLDSALGIRSQGAAARDRLRASLDLDLDRPVVLYAPTARGRGPHALPPLLDIERWASEVGDRVYLLVRSHPSERLEISTRWRWAVRDIGEADLVGDFLVASDLLVTDYSSLIGDAALLEMPIILFQPDRDAYVNRVHGLYVDLDPIAPRAATTSDLVDRVREWLADPAAWERRHAEPMRAFVADHCGPADGASTGRAIAALIGTEGGP